MAAAISQTEREAAEAQEAATRAEAVQQNQGEPLVSETERQSDAIRRASTFFKSTGDHGAVQVTGLATGLATGLVARRHTEDYRRRRGKEPTSTTSQAASLLTPPEQRAQQHTPPTRPCEGACSSRFRLATPGLGARGAAATDHSRQHQDPMASTPWGL